MLAEALQVTVLVGEVLTRLGVPWLIGGSVASSLHGVPRSTQDVDLIADLVLPKVKPLVEALEEAFYISDTAVREAIRRRESFNLIHFDTMTKVDVFVLKPDPLSQAQMRRRALFTIREMQGIQLPLTTPEDIILRKLDWYRKGEGISERQWRDLLGVLQIRGPTLDRVYLEEMAATAGLSDLLRKALEDQGKA